MTTVAFKDGIMAADSRQTGVYIDQIECQKIHVINGDIIGVAGAIKDIKRFLKWYEERDDHNDFETTPELVFDDHFEALVYRKNKLYHYDTGLIPVEVGELSSVGSGSIYAMGSMLGGTDAKGAVEAAMKLDPYSGGSIYYADIEEVQSGKVTGPKKAKGQ